MEGVLAVYVLPKGSALSGAIASRSGIAGPAADTSFVIYYEGNLYGAENILTWADRVYHAAERCANRRPTVTRMMVRHEDVQQVGTFDLFTRRLTVTDPAAVAAWLGTAALDDAETRLTE